MSTEFRAIRKKRTPFDVVSPNPQPPEGDHRKRRRNRTTQSCLNCRTSKRMCDRKRPCGRCTQLGVTGLCVYEVDDPGQRSDTLDESSRLRQRVADLEGVIRELKNKPHPRWARSGSITIEEFEKCHTRARSQSASGESVVESRQQSDLSHLTTNPSADSKETCSEKRVPSLVTEAFQPDFASSFSSSFTGSSAPLSTLTYSPYFDIHSPSSVPSTGIVTPTDEHPQMQIAVAGDHSLTSDIDLASLFMSYPDLLACDESSGHVDCVLPVNNSQHVDPCSAKQYYTQPLDHCGCLNEATSYNVILELSLRLRRAVDVLSLSANHHFYNECPLNQKIVNVDAFVTTALGNMTTSPNDPGPVHLRSRANTAPSGSIPPTFSASSCIPPIRAPVNSPPSVRDHRSWSGAERTADPPASCDDSFMAWEPPHRI